MGERFLKEDLEKLGKELGELVARDAEAFDSVLKAGRLSTFSDIEKERKDKAIAEASDEAAKVPLEVARRAVKSMEGAIEVAEKGNPNSLSDAGVAGLAGFAAVKGAVYNVYINLPSLPDGAKKEEMKAEAIRLSDQAEQLLSQIRKKVEGDLLQEA